MSKKSKGGLVDIAMTKEEKATIKMGIKISIYGRHEKNHYADQAEGAICSECFHFVALAHRFCWFCGVGLTRYQCGGNYEQIAEFRKQHQEGTWADEWEDDE